jgi:hypothetical protein
MMPQAEWYNKPYFSVPPIGERKVAKIKYNNRCAIIIAQFVQRKKRLSDVLRILFFKAANRPDKFLPTGMPLLLVVFFCCKMILYPC